MLDCSIRVLDCSIKEYIILMIKSPRKNYKGASPFFNFGVLQNLYPPLNMYVNKYKATI